MPLGERRFPRRGTDRACSAMLSSRLVCDHGVEETGRDSCCVSQLKSGLSPLNRQETASTRIENVGRPRMRHVRRKDRTRSSQRLPFSLRVPWLRLRHKTPNRWARLQSMEGSLPPPLLQNRACHFCGTRLLSDVPSDIGIRPTSGPTCGLTFRASPVWDIAPSRGRVGLALLQRYSFRSRAHHRPHVSISEALPSTLAS